MVEADLDVAVAGVDDHVGLAVAVDVGEIEPAQVLPGHEEAPAAGHDPAGGEAVAQVAVDDDVAVRAQDDEVGPAVAVDVGRLRPVAVADVRHPVRQAVGPGVHRAGPGLRLAEAPALPGPAVHGGQLDLTTRAAQGRAAGVALAHGHPVLTGQLHGGAGDGVHPELAGVQLVRDPLRPGPPEPCTEQGLGRHGGVRGQPHGLDRGDGFGEPDHGHVPVVARNDLDYAEGLAAQGRRRLQRGLARLDLATRGGGETARGGQQPLLVHQSGGTAAEGVALADVQPGGEGVVGRGRGLAGNRLRGRHRGEQGGGGRQDRAAGQCPASPPRADSFVEQRTSLLRNQCGHERAFRMGNGNT